MAVLLTEDAVAKNPLVATRERGVLRPLSQFQLWRNGRGSRSAVRSLSTRDDPPEALSPTAGASRGSEGPGSWCLEFGTRDPFWIKPRECT